MPYVLPSFNVAVSIWRNTGVFPPGVPPVPPDIQTVGNLSPGKIVSYAYPWYVGAPPMLAPMFLRLPAGTDVRDSKGGAFEDILECPSGSGRTYLVVWVDDIGIGFANEHRFACIVGRTWPVPFPGGSPAPPPPPPPPAPIFLGAAGTLIGPLNNVNVPCNCSQANLLVCVSWVNQVAVPIVTWLAGPAAAIIPASDTGQVVFGVDAGQSAWFVCPAVPGIGQVNVGFPGVLAGYLGVTVYEWASFTGVIRNAGIGLGPPAPEAVVPWALDNNVPQLYLPGGLSNQPAGAATPFNAPFAAITHQANLPTIAQNFWHQSSMWVAGAGGIWTAVKGPIFQDPIWALNEIGVQ